MSVGESLKAFCIGSFMFLIPKNWKSFQHYNKRNPPWIKLHKDLLDDSTFQSLPDASRALAPMLWLLASREKCGTFNAASKELAFRLRRTEQWIENALTPLIDNGLFVVASTTLASCQQLATPETETETETETEITSSRESYLYIEDEL